MERNQVIKTNISSLIKPILFYLEKGLLIEAAIVRSHDLVIHLLSNTCKIVYSYTE